MTGSWLRFEPTNDLRKLVGNASLLVHLHADVDIVNHLLNDPLGIINTQSRIYNDVGERQPPFEAVGELKDPRLIGGPATCGIRVSQTVRGSSPINGPIRPPGEPAKEIHTDSHDDSKEDQRDDEKERRKESEYGNHNT